MNNNARFNRICREIREVKIQGAENIARAAIKALLLRHDKQAIKELLSLRPTEPLLRNSFKFVFSHMDIKEGVSDALRHLDFAQKKIAEIGARLIKNNSIIFTHCHSSTVLKILKEAKRQGKNFEVYQTETRPLFQGRITAKELAKARIKVTHFVDSAAKVALKKADMMIIGSDAITTTRVYNKIGSEMMAIIAQRFGVPVYIASDSWKFDPESIYGREEFIEERSPKEIWPDAPKNVKIKNLAFEAIDPDPLVEGIISEFGIFMKKSFVSEVKIKYPWMFL